MRFLDLLLAATIVYLPYEQHYQLVLPIKGLNAVNVIMIVLALVVALRKHDRVAAPAPLRGRFLLFFLALAVSFTIGQVYDNSRFVDDATYLKNSIFYMLFFFLFYHAAGDERSMRAMWGALMLTILLVSVQGVRQALDYGIATFNPTRRVTGPFGQGSVFGANMAAGFFVIMLPAALMVVLAGRSRPWLRLMGVACVLLGVFATFFTYSRQAYFALAALFVIAGIRRSLAFAIFAAVLAASYQLWVPDSVIQRVDSTEQVSASGDATLDASTESRFLIWQGALKLFSERPWGIGLDQFRRNIGAYVPDYSGFDAHNGFILVLTECGVPGLLAFLWLLLGLWQLARRIEKLPDATSRLYGNALSMAVLGVACSNLFGSRIFNGEVMADFWVMAGLAARHYVEATRQRAAPQEATPPAVVAGATTARALMRPVTGR
ncbi:MAG TPA: O-antigen ligase family protein [Usitatibacter sp.]|nr:O-antigen ligase family protein [Usitatibacter sp.]